MEPFQDKQELKGYKRKLGHKHALATINEKIWNFINKVMKVEVISDEDQQLKLKLKNQGQGMEVLITLVYLDYTGLC